MKLSTKEDINKVLDETVEGTFGSEESKQPGKEFKAVTNEIDEFDLLHAKIDSKDTAMIQYRANLERQIAMEAAKIRAKAAFKASKDPSNPMKIDI